MDTASTILLVDDDPTLRTVLAAVLRRGGYSVLAAESAEEALELLKTHTASAIIADLHMPKMSGLEMLKHLHANGSTSPSILITGELEEMYIPSPGVTAVLIKPIGRRTLLRTLEKLLHPKQSVAT